MGLERERVILGVSGLNKEIKRERLWVRHLHRESERDIIEVRCLETVRWKLLVRDI